MELQVSKYFAQPLVSLLLGHHLEIEKNPKTLISTLKISTSTISKSVTYCMLPLDRKKFIV